MVSKLDIYDGILFLLFRITKVYKRTEKCTETAAEAAFSPEAIYLLLQ